VIAKCLQDDRKCAGSELYQAGFCLELKRLGGKSKVDAINGYGCGWLC
jgi:hypothetical protein